MAAPAAPQRRRSLIGEQCGALAGRLIFLAAGSSPALAGLPFFLEYAWHYTITVWQRTSKPC